VRAGLCRARGDVCKLRVDAVVNSTNETVNEVNGLSERILAAAGRDVAAEIAALDGCRTGEAKMTSGFALPARCVRGTGVVGA
jgi:O-acetyl-ADP-ribose deacetylase